MEPPVAKAPLAVLGYHTTSIIPLLTGDQTERTFEPHSAEGQKDGSMGKWGRLGGPGVCWVGGEAHSG